MRCVRSMRPFFASNAALLSHRCKSQSKKISDHTSEWVFRQVNDRYVRLAQQYDYRSRAAFKLKQIDNKFSLLKKNQVVIELGCYPGGWSQVLVERCFPLSSQSFLLGIDQHKLDDIPGFHSIQGEVGTEDVLSRVYTELGSKRADLILSDMAPRVIGVKADDGLASAELCLRAGEIAEHVLKLGGNMVVKIFMSSQMPSVRIYLESMFDKVHTTKPRASRSDSTEVFFVCKGFKGRQRISEEVPTQNSFSLVHKREGRHVPALTSDLDGGHVAA